MGGWLEQLRIRLSQLPTKFKLKLSLAIVFHIHRNENTCVLEDCFAISTINNIFYILKCISFASLVSALFSEAGSS